jgi:diacylglycerol kinase
MPFRICERAASFRHAFQGILLVIRTQHNAWIHLTATIAVIALGLCLPLVHWEWAALIFALGLVWTAEALNTALEFLADEISQEQRPRLGHAKDAGAAAVLLAAITSAVIGVIVFLPHLLVLMER